ncbi:MAG: hypothetical protein ACXV7G_05320 [Halobacteriota archaeon]
MSQANGKRHVKLAAFGCVKCGRSLFAPNSYRLDDDVEVCTCNAARYKTTDVRAPDHVQAFWDAQCRVAHSSYRRRLKHYALPSVHVDRLASDVHSWRILNVDAETIKVVNPDLSTNALSLSGSDSNSKLINVQQQTVSVWHACLSALFSGLSRVADVARENKGKAS